MRLRDASTASRRAKGSTRPLSRALGRLGFTSEKKQSAPRYCGCLLALHRVVVQNGSAFVATIVPLFAVHAIQLVTPVIHNDALLWLTLSSTAFKILVQEVARRHVLRRRILNPRNMALVVCIPTVMIDTQVRVLLLGSQNARTNLYGSVLLAIVELVVRVGKFALVQRKLRAHPSSEDAMAAAWTQQVLRHHAIEVAADMYSEYLAIGCSSAILFFFGNHAKFRLPGAAAAEAAPVTFAMTARTWGSQLAIELLVDVVSCLAEHVRGLSFEPIQQEWRYFMFLFAAIAVVNVCYSAMLHTNA
ncbi:hypothetical protein PINS_up011066 [Pythium insidiosum]|nr:hypothetical protein PINS_up011066 [Pythium insidiosum]